MATNVFPRTLKIITLINVLYMCEGMCVNTCICIMASGWGSGQLEGAGSLFKPR